MPLVIMCGIPCSGKSELAQKIEDFLKLKKRKTVLVKEENLGSDYNRNVIYADSQLEKQLRSYLKSEVERYLSKDTVVILDAGNYIKGYRYELYCLSKGCRTTHCVIHCDLQPEDCWKFNEKQQSNSQYQKEIFDALVLRIEAPNSMNRWDAPLFIKCKDEELSINEIEDALFSRQAPPPNLSTQCQPLESTNFLHDLDKATQDIVKTIVEAQNTSIVGDEITVPKAEQKVILLRPVTTIELARIRRQFISYTKSHPVSDNTKIPNMFVQYVNKSI